MTSKRELLRQQRSWANARGLEPDTRGYVENVDGNLFKSFSPSTLAGFEQGSGVELKDTPNRPAKMRALHSSAVLAVNVFDYWAEHDAASLLAALGISSSLKSLTFEAQFPTGLGGNPPNLDVALELDDGTVVGIESKFTEWLTPKQKNKAAFKDKYFENGAELWASKGLPRCQVLAANLMSGSESFRSLDASQLLKHSLGLATQLENAFSLYYLYYDLSCPTQDAHQGDIDRFAELVDSELGFKAVSYQELYQRLRAYDEVDAAYLAYIGDRYFSAAG